ncbi:MAG: hypothetical protein HKN05_13445 [Rhizobiales bacterium]|nr:hypothetical protein [Hyphomicrobiales bacterium]
MSQPPQQMEDTEFVKFWNELLAPKFIRFKHVLVDGLFGATWKFRLR